MASKCIKTRRFSNVSKWVADDTGEGGFIVLYKPEKIIFSKKSKYQDIAIIENKSFGRMLFLDGEVQIGELDADVYNKAIVDPIFKRKRRVKKVVILGGGDGGVLHELLSRGIEEAYLVDIDEEVVKACRKYLKKIHKGAFSDRRARIVIQDANEFLKANKGFDAVIYDLTMFPNLGRTKREKYLSEIFKNVKNALKKDGIFSMQMCSVFDKETYRFIMRILKRYFKDIIVTKAFIQPYCEYWLFASAKPK